MDLQDRLKQLENVRDWQGLVEELEKGIQSQSANEAKASFHLRLGQVLEQKFLAGVKALKHFQDAYKLNPALVESLEAARSRLLGARQVEHGAEAPRAGAAHAQGWTAGDRAAHRARRRALRSRRLRQGDEHVRARARDEQRRRAPTRARASRTCRPRAARGRRTSRSCSRKAATARAIAAAKSRLFLRAARITRRFAPDDVLEACSSAPTPPTRRSKQAAALYEGIDGRGGQARRARAASSRRSSQTEADKKRAREARARLRHALGRRVTRTSTRARSSSRSRSSSIPRTRARSTTCATPTGARAATGIACSRSPKRRSRTPARTATRRSSSRRPARSPGVSSAI